MDTVRVQKFFALFFVCAFLVAQPVLAQQNDTKPQIEAPTPDYALLNEQGPLWLPSVDFGGQDLYGVDLAGANLRQANLDRANLANADLSDALLALATLRSADLTKANLRGATLSLADLRQANLHGANLVSAKMQGALLAGANLNRVDLSDADLQESDLRRTDLRFANLDHARLAGANLMGADLANADLSDADLSSVNLANANLDGATLDDITYDSVTVWPSNFDVETKRVSGHVETGVLSDKARDGLSITLTLIPPLLPWYRQNVRPQDGALVESAQQVELLDGMPTGDKMVIFKSADLAEELVPLIADKMDTIGYNLEHGPLTPLHEQNDPVGSVKRLRALADEYGLRLALGPDHRFALSHGALVAPYVDSYAMQVQRVQSDPQTVRDFVMPMAEAVRDANPTIETTLQVRTEGEVDSLVSLIDSLAESIDGVVILSSRETADIAVELVERLQRDRTSVVAASLEMSASEDSAPQESAPQESVTETNQSPDDASSTRPSIASILLQIAVLVLTGFFAYALWWEKTSRRADPGS